MPIQLHHNEGPTVSLIEGLLRTGSILCNRCGIAMSPRTGTCPKCGRAQCFVKFMGQRYYKDKLDNGLSYMSAADMLLAMNRELKAKTFDPLDWLSGSAKARSIQVLIEDWLEVKGNEVRLRELSPGSLKTYRAHSNEHIIPRLGDRDVKHITYHDIEVFKNTLPLELKHKTKRNILYTLHNFMRWLWQIGVIPSIPPFPVVKVTDSIRRTTISREVLHDVLAKIPEEHRNIYEVECLTGIRPGESSALKIKDYDKRNRQLTVQRTWAAGNILREADKEAHRLSIPLSERAIQIIEVNIRGRFPDDFIFINPITKRHYTIQFLQKHWGEWTGLSITHYEGTRHYFGTQIVKLTKNVKTAQKLLRHADARSTMVYVHADIDELRDVMEQHGTVANLPRTTEKEGK